MVSIFSILHTSASLRNEHAQRFKRTGKRNEIFLATKFGFGPMFQGISGTAEDARTNCAKSLERLGIDTIDLYYLHRYAEALVPTKSPPDGLVF